MIYLDHAATTPLDEKVLNKMMPYLTEVYGNPSSQHSFGRRAANAVICARDDIADIMGVPSDDLYFTSGGTEADNLALKGVTMANRDRGNHIVISAIEHPALIESANDLKKFGCEVTFVKPNCDGIVSAEAIKNAMRRDTVFVSVMAANNETGVIQPIKDIYEACKNNGTFFYVDCVQTAGVLPFSLFPADGMGISAHKFYGPKGFGAVYIKRGTKFLRQLSGGHQERAMRGGTTYVAGAVGCAAALKLATENADKNNAYIQALRSRFIKEVLASIDGVSVNGSLASRLPSNANLSFDGCDGENILFLLDMAGIAVSTGSACSSGAVTPSHVLKAMGFNDSRAKSAVRFTFGKDNKEDDVTETVAALKKVIEKIRNR